ncbi:MAG: DUF488 family protein [Bacteriovorax sp.]|nr:DUF488 family protein [Bacteriovorax sp.]
MIKIKRVYEAEDKADGYRVLVDRLWPRGIKKSDLPFDEWPKELCPSTELRKSFAHDPLKFKDFKKEYKKELANISAQKEIKFLAELSAKRNVTLLYAARDEKINHAIILKKIIDRVSKS